MSGGLRYGTTGDLVPVVVVGTLVTIVPMVIVGTVVIVPLRYYNIVAGISVTCVIWRYERGLVSSGSAPSSKAPHPLPARAMPPLP